MKSPATASRLWSIQTLLALFALVACAGAVWRMLNEEAAKRIDETTLLYLAVAGALLLLKDIKSLAFGSYKVEFERKIEELENKVENAQAAAVGRGGSGPQDKSTAARAENVKEGQSRLSANFMQVPGQDKDDPWKGVFGKKKSSGNREVDAEVIPIGTPGLFRIRLEVRSTNPKRDPLRGSVQFFLHPTFANDRPVVTVGPGGVAELVLTAWGAFTVGALADNGETRLEINLAELPTAPSEFKAK